MSEFTVVALAESFRKILYDADLDVEEGSEPVPALKASIRLKNGVDWASRPTAVTPLKSKPALIIGASTGAGRRSGPRRAPPGVRFALGQGADEFDGSLRLGDEKARAFPASRLVAFMEYARKPGT